MSRVWYKKKTKLLLQPSKVGSIWRKKIIIHFTVKKPCKPWTQIESRVPGAHRPVTTNFTVSALCVSNASGGDGSVSIETHSTAYPPHTFLLHTIVSATKTGRCLLNVSTTFLQLSGVIFSIINIIIKFS